MDMLKLPGITLVFGDGIARMNLHGSLDREQMRHALDWFEDLADAQENFRILARVAAFRWPTFGAFAEEVGRLDDVFAWMKGVDRYAVLSDIGWIRAGAWVEGKLIPGLEVKTYTLDETDAAMGWLKEPMPEALATG